MHRYEELERLYYKKLYIKIFVSVIFFIIFIAAVVIINSKKEIPRIKNNLLSKKSTIDANITKKRIKSKNKENLLKVKNTKKTEFKQNKKNVKNKIVKSNNELKFILPNLDFIKEPPKESKIENKHIIKKENNKTVIKADKRINNKINITENEANLKTLINQYNSNQNYYLAITIAKIYLKQNNLKKAQIWALNANGLNPSLPESWLIFSDILIKKNQFDKAKELLKIYLDSYGSNELIEKKLRSIDGK